MLKGQKMSKTRLAVTPFQFKAFNVTPPRSSKLPYKRSFYYELVQYWSDTRQSTLLQYCIQIYGEQMKMQGRLHLQFFGWILSSNSTHR